MRNELVSESSYEWRMSRSHLLSRPTVLLVFRFFWVIVVIWCEFGVFFYSLSDCRWPEKGFKTTLDVKPTRVLLVADVRLWNPAHAAPLSWLVYDSDLAYLRKSWRVASRLRPNVVMFLGDTFASSLHITTEEEYDQYYRAFEAAFPLDPSVPFYLIPGNNDIGLGDSSFSMEARRFFEERFGPLNQDIPISGHRFVLLNAPGLVEEDYRRHAHGLTYDHWNPLPGGPIEFVEAISEQDDGHAVEPKILLSHIPLSRPAGKSCGPLREKGTIHTGAGPGYQTMLGKQTTEFLLRMLRPSMVFSGDNRDYCEVVHEVDGIDRYHYAVREVTIKSFSPSRHIRRPGFQLLSLVPPSSSLAGPTFADAPCLLPDTQRVFQLIYVPCFVVTAFALLCINVFPSRQTKRRLSNTSPASPTRHGRSSSPLELESAIWTTRTSKPRATSPPPLPSSVRLPTTKSVPSYRASPISTPQSSPLLSPITLFPSGDEGEGQDYVGSSHHSYRRDSHPESGWQVVYEDGRERETPESSPHLRPHPHPHPHHSGRATYFVPPPPPLPSSQQRARWSWTFICGGRRRRMTMGVLDWGVYQSLLDASAQSGRHRTWRGFLWRLTMDCVGVVLPAIAAWVVIGWLAF